MILEFEDELSNQKQTDYPYTGESFMPQICVANIYKNATPYNGYNISSINSTQYISSSGVCFDKTQRAYTTNGDNYITLFAYCPYHAFDNASHDLIVTAGM
jgi:hypothetical protein